MIKVIYKFYIETFIEIYIKYILIKFYKKIITYMYFSAYISSVVNTNDKVEYREKHINDGVDVPSKYSSNHNYLVLLLWVFFGFSFLH